MQRLRPRSALAGLVLLTGWLTLLRGQEPAAEKWLDDRALVVSPAPAPVPVLKYRLYPLTTERKEGNAVPIYLRLAHERSDARKRLLEEKSEEWNKVPPDKLPLPEVKKFLDDYRYNFQQLELGARRT